MPSHSFWLEEAGLFNSLRGLGPYFLAHRTQWIWGFVCVLTSVAVSLLGPPYLVRWVIDSLYAGTATTSSMLTAALLIVLSSAVSGAIAWAMRRFNIVASRQITYEVRRDIFNHLTTLDQGYFHRNRTGDLMNRLTGDLNAVQEMLGFGINVGSGTLIRALMSIALMIVLSPMLGLIVLAVFPLIAGLLAVMVRIIAKRYVASQEQFSLISAKVQENFSGIRVVKGYAIEDREITEYKSMNHEYRRRMLSLARADAPEWAAVGLAMNIVFVAVLLLGSRELILSGALAGNPNANFAGLTVGKFVQFFTYLFELSWPMLAVGWMTNVFQRGASSWERLQEILDAEPTIRNDQLTDPSIKNLQGAITFEHVTFKADGRTLLNDVNLEIPKGTTLGLTGRTGSGKTLLAQLISRLLDPTSGRVMVDGVDVKRIGVDVLRGHIGMVPQEPFLFSDTIAENIAFGLPESTQIQHENKPSLETIQWAARVAGLAKDVEDFPDQYQTMLGERGVTLSGGQRQRTALARAVARKPAILILDDSMSAVDTETEARILNELRSVLEDRTVILIGHRVSTLRHADHIVVLENGRIAEQGSHEALIEHGGIYAEMDRKQGLEGALSEDDAPALQPST